MGPSWSWPPRMGRRGRTRLTICGDTDNGFGLLFNWNLLGDGTHAVVALVDGIEVGRASVTVTTLGAEFVEGLTGSVVVADFPRAGEQVRVVWQESQQNFVLAPVEVAAAAAPTPSSGGIEGVLENPPPGLLSERHRRHLGLGVRGRGSRH